MKNIYFFRSLFTFLLLILPGASFAQGTLRFEANGEDFVRQGFTSKDGWQINLEHVYVNLSNIRAYQTNPPYEAEAELTQASIMVGLAGVYLIDLAEGDEDAAPIVVGSAEAAEGFYNALSWQIAPVENESIKLEGTASKDNESISFVIATNQLFDYSCGTFIGDERKGIVTSGAESVTEMTFHLDHLFGDAELAQDDSLNEGALGFDPFAALAQDGQVRLENEQLGLQLSEQDYRKLSEGILPNLGHVGEGHCFEQLSQQRAADN